MSLTSQTDKPEPALGARLKLLATIGDDLDWREVTRRAEAMRPRRRRPRPVFAVTAALVGTVLVASPALGLHQKLLDFFGRQDAPARVEKAFAMLDVGAPPGMGPGVIAAEAREVASFPLSGGAKTTLWVAPTTTGGFCHFFAGSLGGCRSKAENSSTSDYVIGFGMTAPRGRVPFVIGGDIPAASQVETLKLRFADGEESTLPIVWVSSPINAGFYIYEVPPEHQSIGHLPTALVGLDSEGVEVARQALPNDFSTER